ncbi:hypothetical protein [uncultured virus]|uniref:Uncharacterized protein n=1 Tax=uncultured virus TaxID=340016 RepID=A0A218MMU0_9VIRU|nr:hypothetical protein [uncultured virus]
MANIPIWPGSATFAAGKTAFGFYDGDDEFSNDAPLVASWCAQRLGYPLVDIELQDVNFFTAFEEAVSEYGAQVYQFQIINNLWRIKGFSTASENPNGLNQIDLSDVYGSSVGGGASVGSGTSGGGGGSYGEKTYTASLEVKRGTQKYDLLSSTPGYASTTIEWGANASDESGPQTFGALANSASIQLTDTNGVTIFYRAIEGSIAGGSIDGLANDPENPPVAEAPTMVTGSGEFRRYIHISASSGQFATGSYTATNEDGSIIAGTSLGLGGVNGSAAVGDLSASFDSFVSTLENGPHKNSFTISSSLSSSGAHFVTITQKTEGEGGNTSIVVNNMPGVTASAAFTGGSSGLEFEISGSQIQARSKRIVIKKIYHYQPAAINRYFDPYAGTGTGIQSLMQTFGFGNYSPGVNFMLMPMYYDALKLQAIEMNDKIRKSAYHFELSSGRYLRLFPIPTSDYTLWFDYTVANSSTDLTQDTSEGEENALPKADNTITDLSNAPYKRPTYSFINEPGRQWIRKYCLALCKEMLGGIRGKYQSVPIPGSETTLDYSRLLSEAVSEKEALITQLREDLEATTTLSQTTRASDESAATQTQYSLDNPYQIYIH